MDVRQARTDVQAGRLSVEALLDLLDKQEQAIVRLTAEVQRLKQRLAQYEPEVQREATPPKPTAQTPSASYSVDAEEKRRRRKKRRRKKSPGRRPTQLKFADAERFEDIYPDAVPH